METVINRGYQFKLVPTAEQKTYFLQAFGCARKLYNHYVDTLYKHLEAIGYQNGYIQMKDVHLDSPASMKKVYKYMKKTDSLGLCNCPAPFSGCRKEIQ